MEMNTLKYNISLLLAHPIGIGPMKNTALPSTLLLDAWVNKPRKSKKNPINITAVPKNISVLLSMIFSYELSNLKFIVFETNKFGTNTYNYDGTVTITNRNHW
jgi:hypothetical protein